MTQFNALCLLVWLITFVLGCLVMTLSCTGTIVSFLCWPCVCVRADVVLLARLCPDFRGRRVHQMAGAHPNRGESTDTTIIYPPQKTKRERKYPPSHFNI